MRQPGHVHAWLCIKHFLSAKDCLKPLHEPLKAISTIVKKNLARKP